MAITVTINAVDRTSKTNINQIAIDYGLNSDWTATFSVRDTDGTASAYRPALDQSVTIVNGAVTLFKGKITRIEDKPIVSPHVGTQTVITAQSNSHVVDRILLDNDAVPQTRKALVTLLHGAFLAAYGITLDASMSTGDTLEAQSFRQVTLRDAFNHISTITGDVWRITPGDELQFFAAGEKTAGYSLTAANKLSVGPITWDKTREKYVNSVLLRYGTEMQVQKTFTATGTGSVSSWVLDYDPAINADNGFLLSRGLVTEAGADLTLSQPGGGGYYTWTAATNTLTRAAGNLGVGVVITLIYTAQFPQSVTVQDAGEIASNGIFPGVFEAPDIFDKDGATETANGLLRRYLTVPKWVRLSTLQTSQVLPGDRITLTFADRTVSGDHLITQVRISTIAKGTTLLTALTCLSGDEQQESWRDRLRDAVNAGGANAPGGTISGDAVPNFSGRFADDVVSHTGGITTPDFEATLGQYGNASVDGPAVLLARSDQTYRWGIVANSLKGSSPGTVSSLEFVSIQDSGTYRRAATITQADTPVAGEYYLVGSVPGKLSVGAPSGTLGGFSGNARMESVFANTFFELSRSVAMGYWASVTFSAGNFTASAGNWTLTSPDQVTFAYTLRGKTLTIAFSLDTTTVSATPGALFITIPGSFTSAKRMGGAFQYLDNSTAGAGLWRVEAADTKLYLYKNLGATAWATATNTTSVEGVAEFEVQ